MSGKVLEAEKWSHPDNKSRTVAHYWHIWNTARQSWRDEHRELRAFLFATDTRKTSTGTNGWKNSTTLPKLTQIRDNLHANYLSALFPNEDWLRWEAHSKEDNTKQKRDAILGYVQNKAQEGNLRQVASDLLYDYIDYGNAFAQVRFAEKVKDDIDDADKVIAQYTGPEVVRIDPNSIVFNPLVEKFEDSPVIIRELTTMGELKAEAEDYPDDREWMEAVTKAEDIRREARGWTTQDVEHINSGFFVDGFGNYMDYLRSGQVEILRFYGDYHDVETGEFKRNVEIIVMDRLHLVKERPQQQWQKRSIFHVGWRKRPDNLWSMGPLDNLIGMQYRIDHLENLKADAFDMIAFPMVVKRGEVSDFDYMPGEEIEVGDDGSVEFLRPDTTALNADFQIQELMNKMEEFAGAPREAMGIRSPGEKTAFEVQQLVTAAGRIFQEKISTFELSLLEPVLNAMLESARRNLNFTDLIRVYDNDSGIDKFLQVTKEDITASGVLRPIGARHFSEQAQNMQNLLGVMNSPLGQMIQKHMKTTSVAKMLEDTMGLGKYELFEENAYISEQMREREQQVSAEEAMQQRMGSMMEENVDDSQQ